MKSIEFNIPIRHIFSHQQINAICLLFLILFFAVFQVNTFVYFYIFLLFFFLLCCAQIETKCLGILVTHRSILVHWSRLLTNDLLKASCVFMYVTITPGSPSLTHTPEHGLHFPSSSLACNHMRMCMQKTQN